MVSLIIWFVISVVLLWLITMAVLWKKQEQNDVVKEINPLINKVSRKGRRVWFVVQRAIKRVQSYLTAQITKLFFMIFPDARAAFEEKDVNTLIERGPSSDFLISISEAKMSQTQKTKRHGRKPKNV